jgi:protein kinase-like protein
MIGRTLGHYTIEAPLGQGGMGVVYQARDTRLGRTIALKLLPPEFGADADRKARFLQEARAAASVSHPALAQVYDVDECEDGVFIAMELVPGKTVDALIHGRELDLAGALEVAMQVAGGLQKAHEAGIVHRDIKPSNVMVTPDGHAKILDFGLAKLADSPSGAHAVSQLETLARTKVGIVLGTIGYMSPEQARGLPVDHRSDIFSFGVLLYEMATGQRPFSGATPLDTLHAIAFDEIRPLTQLRPNVPPHLQQVVARCLRKRPEDRYSDCREMLGELKVAKHEADSGITGSSPWRMRLEERFRALSRARPADLLLWAVGAALAGGVVFFVLDRASRNVGRVFWIGFVALFIWRRYRNRRQRLAKRFLSRARRLPEVRAVTLDGTKLTVIADKAVAKTYVRLHAEVDSINASMFLGDPFTLVVRDDVSPDEVRAILGGPGILYVRDDPPAPAVPRTVS